MTEVILTKPIKNFKNGNDITSVTVNEPTGKILKDAQFAGGKGDTSYLVTLYQYALISGCTGLPVELIETMTVKDIGRIDKAISDFLSDEK
jgi:Phage tail assembly chaperone proteins, E, or 41 or 14